MNIYRHTLWFILLNLHMAAAVAAPVGSGFSYQGELEVAGEPANAAFDFEFVLFNVTTGGAPLNALTRDTAGQSGGDRGLDRRCRYYRSQARVCGG